MVKDELSLIIYENLKDNLELNDINSMFSSGCWKYTIYLKFYLIEICYEVMGNFYTIKIENRNNNFLNSVMFLSKSKKFKKDLNRKFKEFSLNNKTFKNHVFIFTMWIKDVLEINGDLKCFEKLYKSDLKFDGIFI